MSRSYAKTFYSHIHRRLRLIRNRDTAVIIRLNNSLSPGLSKNVPMVPPSFFTFLHLRRHRYPFTFPLVVEKTNRRPASRKNSEKLFLIPGIFKGLEVRRGKQPDRIDSIARNKSCHTAVTERPSSRYYFLRTARQTVCLIAPRIFLFFNMYSWSVSSDIY